MKRVAAGVLALVACTGSDPDPVVPAASADGNVLQRSTFEETNCLGWTNNQAALTHDDTAKTGRGSCRVCADHAMSVWGFFQEGPKSLSKGDYIIIAYVHAVAGSAVQHVAIRANRLDSAGNETPDSKEQTVDIAPNDPTWQKATFELSIQGGGDYISVGAFVSDTLNGCFLVDDFTLAPKK